MDTKTFDRVELKAQPEGRFTALISTFNVRDSRGDIVRPGAFTASIARWQRTGGKVPVIYSHQASDIHQHIGHVDPANLRETASGLEADGELYLDEAVALKVFRQLQRKALREWSFGYLVQKAKNVADGARELLAVDLLELGPTLCGAGTTETITVKAATADDRRRDLARVELAPYRQRLDLAQRRVAIDLALARGR